MDIMYLSIIVFLIILAVFDLTVGVSNDAVNFLNSAIGAKVASYKTIVAVAAVGIFTGAAMSNGMMDVARHGIMTPEYFSFYDVICLFLAVMVTDIILLDIFNTLGMPTSTTVSMVFELLGGAFAIAILKILNGATNIAGKALTLGDLLNTEKALTCILGIFLSVAVAFLFGTVVMWFTRLILTFKPNKIILIMARWTVLAGTGLLAFSFASNDLVNFVGVPLTGLDAYQEYAENGGKDASSFMMTSLMESAQTPAIYLVIAGVVMVLSLIFSRKAQNVVKTSVDLSRRDEADEMFGSSGTARILVRTTQRMASSIERWIPQGISRWIDQRFNDENVVLAEGAAFDPVRAAVNLILAGGLVALGTAMKLPLSTTYVTFMVAMGTSLADRAWSRESAVFRITGVLSVIGGWFITAGAAFVMCYLATNALWFGGFIAMFSAIIVAIVLLVRSHLKFTEESNKSSESDDLFKQLLRTEDKNIRWQLLQKHVLWSNREQLLFARDCYEHITTAFIQEEYRPLKRATQEIETARKQLKRNRKREIIGLQKIAPILAVEKNTWYWVVSNALEQLLYSLKRINDPCREHIGNNFPSVPQEYALEFIPIQKQVVNTMNMTLQLLTHSSVALSEASQIREQADHLQKELSAYRKRLIDSMQLQTHAVEATTVLLNTVQESQQILSCIRHTIRGLTKFTIGYIQD